MKTGIPTPFPYIPVEYAYHIEWDPQEGKSHSGVITLHLYANDPKANHVHLTVTPAAVSHDLWWLTDVSFPVFMNEVRPTFSFRDNEDADHYDNMIRGVLAMQETTGTAPV